MKKLIVVFLLVANFGFAQQTIPELTLQEKIAWTKQHAHPVQSIEFAVDNLVGLHFLKKTIGNRRIVFLGEHTHGDGTTKVAKSSIVKYLHEEMGFHVLITEYDLYRVSRIRELAKSQDELFWYAMAFNHRYLSTALKPLYQYMYHSWKGPKPLQWAGLDMTRNISEGMRKYFEKHISEIDSSLINTGQWQSFHSHLSATYDSTFTKELAAFRKEVDYFVKMAANKAATDKRFKYLQQNLENAYGYAYFMAVTLPFPQDEQGKLISDKMFDAYMLRDSLMANNLLWYLDHFYQHEKVIVWTSTYHISRNIDDIKRQSEHIKKAIPMGDYVWQKYKDDIYSIAFITYEGERGDIKKGGVYVDKNGYPLKTPPTIHKVEPVAEQSIEAILKETGYKYAFLDISGNQAGTWLKQPNWMHPTFDKPYQTDWTKIYDGLFFIRTMQPDMKLPIYHFTRVPHNDMHKLFMKYPNSL